MELADLQAEEVKGKARGHRDSGRPNYKLGGAHTCGFIDKR